MYDVVTDRFSNGDSGNNGAYGRGLDGTGTPYAVDSTGHFLGGDWNGLEGWLQDGYFDALGVDVLVMSSPFEQVHGWVPGNDPSVQRYAFDGRWTADYTEHDEAFGSLADFASLVDAAHAKGIRIILDVALTSPGPVTLHDMVEFGYGASMWDTWRTWRPTADSWSGAMDALVLSEDSLDAWARWWGPDWIRANLPGYDACSRTCDAYVPEFRHDGSTISGLPAFLALKWGNEKTARQDAWLKSYLSARSLTPTVASIQVAWLTEWVRAYGIDGIRIADFHDVSDDTRSLLARELSSALSAWRIANPAKALDTAPFQLLAPVDPFESLHTASLDSLYAGMVGSVGITAISSLDTGLSDRAHVQEAGTRLLLTPGPVLLVYGDESGRTGDSRSFMNWGTSDEDNLARWRQLGSFRKAHPAIAGGEHIALSDAPYAFARVAADDQVVVAFAAEGRVRLNVSRVWPDDTAVRDVMSGRIGIVSFGQVTFQAHESGMILLEEVR